MDKLPVESTRKLDSLFHVEENLKGLRTKPNKMLVPVPRRARLLGLYGTEERAELDRLRDESERERDGKRRIEEGLKGRGTGGEGEDEEFGYLVIEICRFHKLLPPVNSFICTFIHRI